MQRVGTHFHLIQSRGSGTAGHRSASNTLRSRPSRALQQRRLQAAAKTLWPLTSLRPHLCGVHQHGAVRDAVKWQQQKPFTGCDVRGKPASGGNGRQFIYEYDGVTDPLIALNSMHLWRAHLISLLTRHDNNTDGSYKYQNQLFFSTGAWRGQLKPRDELISGPSSLRHGQRPDVVHGDAFIRDIFKTSTSQAFGAE